MLLFPLWESRQRFYATNFVENIRNLFFIKSRKLLKANGYIWNVNVKYGVKYKQNKTVEVSGDKEDR